MKQGWTEVALGDVCDIQIGKTPPRADGSYWGGDHPWLSISDMNQGRSLSVTSERITTKAVQDLNCRVVPAGTVLLSFKLSIGKVGITSIPMYTNEAIAHLPISVKHLDPTYLYWALRTVPLAGGADRAAMGSTLNKSKLAKIRFPLPPLEEQKRIAAILDKADELLAKRRAAIAHLDSLTQAIFLDMFGDPASNPKRFPSRPLADVAQFLDHERRPITAADREPGPVPYFGANGVQGYVAEHLFDEPLVLVAEDGGYFDQPNRGIAYFIQGRSWVNNHAHVLRVSEDVDERFLTMAIRHRDVSQFLTGSTRAKLTKTAASRIPVAIPPFDRQVKFGELDQRTQELRDQQSGKLLVMSQLIASLQARAFRGDL